MTPIEREEIGFKTLSKIHGCKPTLEDCNYRSCSEYFTCKSITEAIFTQVEKARKEALEEAAKIADKHWATKFPQSGFARASKDIASEIRNQNKLNQQGE